MQVIKDKNSLSGAIRQLESRRVSQADALREQWDLTQTNLNPMTIVKDELRETITSPNFGMKVAKGLFSVVSGYFTKRLIVGSSGSAFKKALGTIAQTGATGVLLKNTDQLTQKGASALSSFLKKLKI
ncbi:MAG: hypothetical protein ITG00_06215 [Flavobacterium sp.]|nr:hypothetical protein [Flavobacterium sp.]